MPHFKMIIETGQWPTLEQRRQNVARLLRNAAERIEQGDDFGGFHFSASNSNPGGFAFCDEAPGTDWSLGLEPFGDKR